MDCAEAACLKIRKINIDAEKLNKLDESLEINGTEVTENSNENNKRSRKEKESIQDIQPKTKENLTSRNKRH